LIKKTLSNLKKQSKAIATYSSDFDFTPPNKITSKYHTLYNLIMDDIEKTFNIKKPYMQVKNGMTSYVSWYYRRGNRKNKWINKVVLALHSYSIPEHDTLHEIAHIVEHYFTGSSSNAHGVKFYKYYNALLKRYNLYNKI
jgi:hypothetical protein